MTPWRRAVPLVASAVLSLAACGNSAKSPEALSETQAPETTSTTAPSPLASAGPPTPRQNAAVATPSSLLTFKAPAIGGGQVDASVFQGRPTLLWFWAPW